MGYLTQNATLTSADIRHILLPYASDGIGTAAHRHSAPLILLSTSMMLSQDVIATSSLGEVVDCGV